jgi:hypothetical protein
LPEEIEMALTKRTPASYSTAIQQRIASGGSFDGTVPQQGGVTADSALVGAVYKYPETGNGGLFFWNASEAIVCGQFHVDLGGSGDMSLYLVNLDPASPDPTNPQILAGERILVESQAGVQFVRLDESQFKVVLLPGQALQLITTAGGASQIAQAVASIERTYIR